VIFDSGVWVALASDSGSDQRAITAAFGDEAVFNSVVSLGELSFGVHACPDPAERALRAAYLRKL
jgi:hypothetical protein